MNETDADKLLRDLFKEAGPFSAPDGLDARILQRIAVTPRTAIAIERPLLPTWIWVISAVLVACVVFVPGGAGSIRWTAELPSMDLGKVFTSPWLLMGLATCAALFGLDAWLNTRRSAALSR